MTGEQNGRLATYPSGQPLWRGCNQQRAPASFEINSIESPARRTRLYVIACGGPASHGNFPPDGISWSLRAGSFCRRIPIGIFGSSPWLRVAAKKRATGTIASIQRGSRRGNRISSIEGNAFARRRERGPCSHVTLPYLDLSGPELSDRNGRAG